MSTTTCFSGEIKKNYQFLDGKNTLSGAIGGFLAWGHNQTSFVCCYAQCQTMPPLFSSPEQRSRRAIVLPPASALASASTNVKFSLKFLRPQYFLILSWI